VIFDTVKFYFILLTEINFEVDQKILETDSHVDTHKRFFVHIKIHSKLLNEKKIPFKTFSEE